MADNADIANELIQERMDKALEERRLKAQIPSAKECVECGVNIPKERQEILRGVQTCVGCAEINERKSTWQ